MKSFFTFFAIVAKFLEWIMKYVKEVRLKQAEEKVKEAIDVSNKTGDQGGIEEAVSGTRSRPTGRTYKGMRTSKRGEKDKGE